MSLYKFTYILLLKNDVQLKQKSDKQPKKNTMTQIYFKKIMSKKKSRLNKRRRRRRKRQHPVESKRKKEKKENEE